MISPWHQHFHASRKYLIRLIIFFLILRKSLKKNIIFRYYETSLVTKNDDVNYFASLKILLWFFRWKGEYQFFRIRNLAFSYQSFLYFCDIYKLIFRIAPWKIAFSLNCCPFFHFQKALSVFLQRTSNLRFTTHNWGIKLIYTKPILIDNSSMAEKIIYLKCFCTSFRLNSIIILVKTKITGVF